MQRAHCGLGIALATWTALALAGCATNDDIGYGEDALARPGAWSVPSSTRAIANSQYVAYDSAGPWIGSAGCGGGLLAGTAEVRHYLLEAFPQISGAGGYSCRANTGATSQMSVHGTGRALDLFIPLSGGAADNDLGDPVANWLIEHTEEIGIQYLIWDRWQWNASRPSGSKDRAYTGPHPHHDHLHVELTEEAAARRTAWFSAPSAPPAVAPSIPRTCDAGTTYTPQFCDDDGHWAEASIQYLHRHSLTAGCGTINGKPRYCPEESATRAQAIVIIGRASDMPLSGHPDAFDDDTGHFGERALNAAAAFGITSGCGTRRVCPNEAATRSHVATFLVRTFGLGPASRDYFDDDAGSPFENAHNRLAEAGITSGCGTRRFCGTEISTRAMLAVFVHRVHSRGLPAVWDADDLEPAGADVPPDAMEPPPPPASEPDAGPGGEDPSEPTVTPPDGEDPASPSDAGPSGMGPGETGSDDAGVAPGADPWPEPAPAEPSPDPTPGSSGSLAGACSIGPTGGSPFAPLTILALVALAYSRRRTRCALHKPS